MTPSPELGRGRVDHPLINDLLHMWKQAQELRWTAHDLIDNLKFLAIAPQLLKCPLCLSIKLLGSWER